MPDRCIFRLKAFSAHSMLSLSDNLISIIVPRFSGCAESKRRGRPASGGPAFTSPTAKGGSTADLDDVLRRRTLLALDDVELDGLALGERLEALSLDGRVMHEAILLAVVRGDEAKALRVVEPLHLAGGTHHGTLFLLLCPESGGAVPPDSGHSGISRAARQRRRDPVLPGPFFVAGLSPANLAPGPTSVNQRSPSPPRRSAPAPPSARAGAGAGRGGPVPPPRAPPPDPTSDPPAPAGSGTPAPDSPADPAPRTRSDSWR